MRVVSLDPSITEIVSYLGAPAELVGVSFVCDFPDDIKGKPRIRSYDDWAALKPLSPDLILLSIKDDDDAGSKLNEARARVRENLGDGVAVYSFAPRTLNQVFESFEELGKVLSLQSKGRDLAQRLKAQVMDWCDNFYERMRNKRVSFLCSIKPLALAGFWIPDLIHMCSAVSQMPVPGDPNKKIEFKDIIDFKPDVIVVAPTGYDTEQSLASFKILEKIPGWDDLPAVKRGQAAFCEGRGLFHRWGPRLIDSMGVLVSAIAGFDSGYITPRDSFYRLRWLEMQRHRF